MMRAPIGNKVIELRKEREWTQYELGRRAGIVRGTIASIESGKSKEPTTEILLRLARAFKVRPEELYYAAGYIIDTGVLACLPKETSEDILERLRLAHPVSIPIYSEFPVSAGEGLEPVEYVYRERTKPAPKNIEGYLIHGDSLAPHVIHNDIVIVDRDGQIDNGDIVAALVDGRLYISRFRKVGGELLLENNHGRIKFNECQVAALVIEVIRRLK